MSSDELSLGIDVGTSGVRCAVVRPGGEVVETAESPLPPSVEWDGRPAQDPENWWQATVACVRDCTEALGKSGADPSDIGGLAVDGTSGTALACDGDLRPLTLALMYDSANFAEQARPIAENSPDGHMARGGSSALARLLYLQDAAAASGAKHLLHQADWIAARLCGTGGFSDANNSLKSGYDPEDGRWPDWVGETGMDLSLLPQVKEPGTQVGVVEPGVAGDLGLPGECRVHLGTTDSVAAFLASGAAKVGEASTALGTTLAVKVLADRQVSDLDSGVYSHRIGGAWLPGGASNSGGAAVARHFGVERIRELTPSLRPDEPTGYDHYPLPGTGERFPVNDHGKESVTEPRPGDDATFLQALLEGVAAVERLAYERMRELGAPWPSVVHTVGGGAANEAWSAIRSRVLGTRVVAAGEVIAAAGVARLARGPVDLAP